MLKQKIDNLKVRLATIKQEVQGKIRKCLTFNQLYVVGYR